MRPYLLVFLAAFLTVPAVFGNETVIYDFLSGEKVPEGVVLNHCTAEPSQKDGGGLRVLFSTAEWPNVTFNAPGGFWDWKDYSGIAVTLHNPGTHPVETALRVDNAGADGWNHCNNARTTVLPGSEAVLRMRFKDGSPEKLWGMRGLPVAAPLGEGDVLDLAKISAFQVFLPRPQEERVLCVKKVALFTGDSDEASVKMPFINKYGQYMHQDWAGKIKSDGDFTARREREAAEMAEAPALSGRDRFGGWAEGPKLEATGWFRTEKVDGKWWLVTPEGTLFFSMGVDCVGTWEQTFVEKREEWFEELPAEGTPEAAFYGHAKNAHSMAEPIGGEGRTFSFYRANLYRKHGEQWADEWRRSVYTRLRHWGFNTIGNWSQEDVMLGGDIPYTCSTGLWDVPKIAGAKGYWAKMMDVYAPEFSVAAERAAAAVTEKHKNNPLCIGYFIDNELAWEGVKEGVLASPAGQPAKTALVDMLKKKHVSLEALNNAWSASFASWENIAKPSVRTTAFEADMSEYLREFSLRYFMEIRNALRRHAPNHLYLGCRFSGAPDESVKACAEAADLVSFNLYYPGIPADKFAGLFDKPAIIGEFHFGALDRGMFHTGLVAARDQQDRADAYCRYVESVARHPLFVGCHWFQFVDEPTTGRWYDGENYNIGFLDITDTPYPEMVRGAQRIHRLVYQIKNDN